MAEFHTGHEPDRKASARLRPTIVDVAHLAGVSVRTASRVVNKSTLVNSETRTRVEEAILTLDFSPSSRARGLRSGRSNLIGVIQGDANAHVIGAFQHGILASCTAQGFELVVHSASIDDPDMVHNIRDFIRRSRVDGVIVLSPTSEDPALPAALSALGVPAVAIAARRVEGYPAMLVSDERAAAADMADHLHTLGHRRIGLVTGPVARLSSQERAGGFLAALAARETHLESHHCIQADYSFEGGLDAGLALLSGDNRPTAIFACNDISALGVLKAAATLGLRVPDQVAVAGFDGSDIGMMVSPALTTIRRPLDRMARMATASLIAMIDDPSVVETIESFALELVQRGSTMGGN